MTIEVGRKSTKDYEIKELEKELEVLFELERSLCPLEDEQMDNDQIMANKAYQREVEADQEEIFNSELIKYLEEESEMEKNQFLSLISHELLSPLVPVMGYVEMLDKGKFGSLNEIQRKTMKVIKSNTDLMFQLLSTLIEYQKLSTGSELLNRNMNDLATIIQHSMSSFKLNTKQDKMQMSHFYKEIPVLCDEKRILQVLSHLFDYISKFTSQKPPQIRISVMDMNREVKIRIIYNIKGNSKTKMIDDIFSKRHHDSISLTGETGGIGLELALCKKIIQLHDGKIWTEHRTGNEMELNFTLPKM